MSAHGEDQESAQGRGPSTAPTGQRAHMVDLKSPWSAPTITTFTVAADTRDGNGLALGDGVNNASELV
jgi:hypothetical protein